MYICMYVCATHFVYLQCPGPVSPALTGRDNDQSTTPVTDMAVEVWASVRNSDAHVMPK